MPVVDSRRPRARAVASPLLRPILLVVLAVAAYANTVAFDYALDDKIVITENRFTTAGLAGLRDIFTHDALTGYYGSDTSIVAGGRYRPLPLATHAIEYQLFGKNPAVSHLVNVVAFALTVLALFALMRRLRPESASAPWYRDVPFLATAFFAVHPIHTEVVANIKGRDDVLSLVFALGALWYWLTYVRARRVGAIVAASVLFFASLMSKESAITLLAVGPLVLWWCDRRSAAEIARGTAPLVVTAIVYVVVRVLAIGGVATSAAPSLMNDPFLFATTTQKYATIVLTWLLYLKLLIFPQPLTHDYYPYQIALVDFAHPLVVASLAVHALLVWAMLAGIRRRAMPSFCIALYAATFAIYSNLFFVVHTFMNERFLYAASIAYCLFVAWAIATYARAEVLASAVAVVLVAAGLGKTVTRNFAWRDDVTLALTDVQTSTGSARAHAVAGYAWLQLADGEKVGDARVRDVDRAIDELRTALRIHPIYYEALNMTAYALAQRGKYPEALDFYARCLERKPRDHDLVANVEYVAQQAAAHGDTPTAIRAYDMVLAQQPTAEAYGALAEIYGRDVGDLAKARALLESGLRLAPDDVDILTKLGVVAGMSGDSERAVALFDAAIAHDPRNATLYVDRAMALRQLGRVAEADEATARARELDPTIGGQR